MTNVRQNIFDKKHQKRLPKQHKSLGLDDDETPTSNKRSRSADTTDTLIQQRENSENHQTLKERNQNKKNENKSCLELKEATNWPAKRFYEHRSRQYETTTTTNTTIDSNDQTNILKKGLDKHPGKFV